MAAGVLEKGIGWRLRRRLAEDSLLDRVAKAGDDAYGGQLNARLEALLGLTIGDVSVQVLSGKQAIVFPSISPFDSSKVKMSAII